MAGVSKSVQNTLKVMKFFGFLAISIENGKSVTKPTDLLLFATHFITGCVLMVLTIIYRGKLVTSGSEIIDMGNFSTFIAAILMVLSSMTLSFIFRHKVWNILLKLESIDRALEENGLEGIDTRIGKATLLSLIFVICFTIPLLILVYWLEGSTLKICVYTYGGTYYMICISAVLGLTNGSLYRLKSFTKAFQKMLDSSSTKLANERIARDVQVIKLLMEVYVKIINVFRSINLCFGLQTMMGTAILFFYTNFTLYMAYKNWSITGKLTDITNASLILASYLQLFTFAVIFACTLSEKETRAILKATRSIISKSRNEKKVAVLISFNELIKRNPPKFSPGLFDYDWTLIYGVS